MFVLPCSQHLAHLLSGGVELRPADSSLVHLARLRRLVWCQRVRVPLRQTLRPHRVSAGGLVADENLRTSNDSDGEDSRARKRFAFVTTSQRGGGGRGERRRRRRECWRARTYQPTGRDRAATLLILTHLA